MADNKKPNMNMLGNSGLTRYGGYVYEEFLTQLRWPKAGEIYKEMADNDPVIGAIMYMLEMLIRKAKWDTEPASDKAEDVEAAEFLKSCLHDMEYSWADTISEILSMMTYGFSFHELVYKIRRGPDEKGQYRSKFTDGRVGWRRMPIRAQSTLWHWDFADDGDIKAFNQMSPPYFKLTNIPLEKGLLFRTRVSRDNPEGKSLLRNAYRPWYFKKRIEEIEGIGIERDLVGLPVLKAPEGLDLWSTDDPAMVQLKANAETMVKNIRRDQEEGVLLPFGWELALLNTSSSRIFDTNSVINRYDNRIAITLLSDLVLIGSDKAGSFALADTKSSLLATSLDSQLNNIADIINKYAVPKLFRYNNFPNITDYPRITHGSIESPGIKELALLLRAMGLDISKDMELMNYLRKISDLPQMDKATFEEVYANQVPVPVDPNVADTDPDNVTDTKPDNVDDTAQNDLEQNDMAYTGQ